MTGPLDGIRVLDLSRVMAGPWAGQVFADLGADVIKVERPDTGDDTRSWGPPYLTDEQGSPTPESGYFMSVNRGKRSLTADLSTTSGQAIVRDLASRSDIVLENFKVGTLARYGLDYERLRQLNPPLIYCSITGFGQTGPRRQQAAYDFMIQAMGGLMSVTGPGESEADAGPQKVGVPIVDIMSGMYASIAVLAALHRRDVDGVGEHIDLAMYDVQLAFLANQAQNYLVSGVDPVRRGNRHPNIQPQDVFACGSGHLAIAVGNDGQFVRFAAALGHPGWSGDDRFATNAGRVTHVDMLGEIIVDALSHRDALAWAEILEAVEIPCSPINSVSQALDDVQARHRGMVVETEHPRAGIVRGVRSPFFFANSRLDPARRAPLLGEHTEEILEELGRQVG